MVDIFGVSAGICERKGLPCQERSRPNQIGNHLRTKIRRKRSLHTGLVLFAVVSIAFIMGVTGTVNGEVSARSGAGTPRVDSSGSTSNNSGVNTTREVTSSIPQHLGPTPVSNGTRNITTQGATHVKFGGIFNSASGGSSYCSLLENYCEISEIIMNITIPQAGGGGDTLFEGMSVFDTANYYDQMGIATGNWLNQGGGIVPECVNTFAWCDYFSFASTGTSGCPDNTYYGIMDGYLARDYTYQFQLVDDESNGGIYFHVYNISGSTPVLFDYGSYSTGGGAFYLSNQYVVGLCSYDDYTNYEEWPSGSMNPVEPWPCFNFHTKVYAEDVTSMSWSQYSISTPSGFTGALVSIVFANGWSWMNVTNEPFRTWVGNFFGEGMYNVSVSNTHSNTIYVSLNAVADPNSGYSVYLQYLYCQVPCSDVSFTPTNPSVSTNANYHLPDAYVTVTLPSHFAAGTCTMAVYAEYTAESTWTVTDFWLVVT